MNQISAQRVYADSRHAGMIYTGVHGRCQGDLDWLHGSSSVIHTLTLNHLSKHRTHPCAPQPPPNTKMPDMLEQTNTLLAALKKPSTNVDQRLQLFSNVKSNIKHNRVPEECQAPIFECIRIAISATTSATLVSTGFSTLSHFIKRLQLQRETTVITSQSSKLCQLLADKLGDARESHRSAALQILVDLHPLCPIEVETLIHNAMKGANARAKDTSMTWVVKVRSSASSMRTVHIDADVCTDEPERKPTFPRLRGANDCQPRRRGCRRTRHS
jgi:hypothetical protein